MTQPGYAASPASVEAEGAKIKPSEVLAKAADLIEPEGRWTQHYLARVRPNGNAIGPHQANAQCWCAIGALDRAGAEATTLSYRTAVDYLSQAIGQEAGAIAQFNDAPERTQAEVVKALRDASALALSEGQ
jgi:hypothetical protein